MGGGLNIGVCSDTKSWMNKFLPNLIIEWITDGHEVCWAHDASDLPKGDICFYLSYGRIVSCSHLSKHFNNLVVHASDLPKGRGWSPMTWKIIEGDNDIPVTLFEASEAVDSGPIYKQEILTFSGDELLDEMQHLLVKVIFRLCSFFVKGYPDIVKSAIPQQGEPTFYPRRCPEDSQLDIYRPLIDQFNLLRTVDNAKYPAWFEYKGRRYYLRITPSDDSCMHK